MKIVQFTIPVAANHIIYIQEDRLPHFYPHLHRHIETQITLILSGEGTLIAGNSMQPFKSGDFFIIGANQPHLFKSSASYFKKNKKKAIHSVNIFFNPSGPISALFNFPESRSIKTFLEKTTHGKQALPGHQKLMGEYVQKLRTSTKGFRISVFLELLQTMADIKKWKPLASESIQPVIRDVDGLRMNDVYQYTIANFSDNITLQRVAALTHLTPQSFCRYFRKHTSKTYIRFLNEVRINEACRILTDMKFRSVADVAYQTGFNHVVTFNRVFKSVKKQSPVQFLNAYQSGIQ